MEENEISKIIIGAAIKIHRKLGPGLLESAYEECMAYELTNENLQIERQKSIPLIYERIIINNAYKADIIVEDKVLIELKSVENVLNVHKAQLLTYLNFSNKKLGLLINFNSELLKNGIIRVVNKL